MATAAIVHERFVESFELYDDLVREAPEEALALKLPGLASNTVGAQLWCVVGARESFAGAIRSGAWQGFACSLTAEDTRNREALAAGLAHSAGQVLEALDGLDPDDDERVRLALRLLEHESSHQGQLIRYLYGLRLPIPASWKARYALD
jgi:hypothetical protein